MAEVRRLLSRTRERLDRIVPMAPPAVVMGFGAWWCAGLIVAMPENVFYSGDGGLKGLMVQQLAAGHWVPWLEFDEPEWLRALWNTGMFPFSSPFAYRIDGEYYASFEWAFPALAAPGYRLAGYRGLYFLPALAVVFTWVRFTSLARHLGARGAATTVGLSLLVFATPLSFYAGTFWEHAPAVALAFAGFADLLQLDDQRRSRALRAGLWLALAAWLRPEAVIFGVAAVGVALSGAGWRRAVPAAGCLAIILGLSVVVNLLVYHHWLGVHAIESLERLSSLNERYDASVELAERLGDQWVEHVQLTWLAMVLIGGMLSVKGGGGRAVRRSVAVALITFVGVAAIVPNDGGLQIGPRYLLLLVPLMALVTALGIEHLRRGPAVVRWVLTAAVCVTIVVGAKTNLNERSEEFRRNCTAFIAPPMRAIASRPHAGLVFRHQWGALEMAMAMQGRPVVTIESGPELDLAVEAMIEHGHEVLLVDGPNDRRFNFTGARRHGRVEVNWRVLSAAGEYGVLLGTRADST